MQRYDDETKARVLADAKLSLSLRELAAKHHCKPGQLSIRTRHALVRTGQRRKVLQSVGLITSLPDSKMARPAKPCIDDTCPNLRPCPVHGERGNASQRGYDAGWERERRIFLIHNPVCVGCGGPANTVDHDPPHGGDSQRFWDRSTWQPMCASCHNGKRDVLPGRGVMVLR